MEVCKQRDPNGVYKLAEAGKLAQFPGVSAAFEPPPAPDLTLPTHEIAVEESVDRIVALLKSRAFLGLSR